MGVGHFSWLVAHEPSGHVTLAGAVQTVGVRHCVADETQEPSPHMTGAPEGQVTRVGQRRMLGRHVPSGHLISVTLQAAACEHWATDGAQRPCSQRTQPDGQEIRVGQSEKLSRQLPSGQRNVLL